MYPQPAFEAAPLRPAPRVGIPLDDDEYGLDCHVCRTRLHVRRSQIGQTVKCPDCFTSLLVKPPPVRKQAQPVDYEEAEMFKLSEPVELPVMTFESLEKHSEGAVSETPVGAASPDVAQLVGKGRTAMQNAARTLLEKAKAQQVADEADEREHSAERFTQGLLAFLADRPTLVRLGVLAVWLEVAVSLFHGTLGIRGTEGSTGFFTEAGSAVALAALAAVGLGFLYAVAACGLALVQDSAQGLTKVVNWPGWNVFGQSRQVLYIVSAGVLAALPGVAAGVLLGVVGLTGLILYTAAASFAGLFPPMLLSMFESESAFAPFNNDVWVGVRERPDPWKLTYLITSLFTLGGLIAFIVCLVSGFVLSLLAAVVVVTCILVYFRTVGWLVRFLEGRDIQPAGGTPRP